MKPLNDFDILYFYVSSMMFWIFFIAYMMGLV